jgi:hypothetical protein
MNEAVRIMLRSRRLQRAYAARRAAYAAAFNAAPWIHRLKQ